MVTQLSALIRKSDITNNSEKNITTVQDLIEYNNNNVNQTTKQIPIPYGVLRSGSTYAKLKDSNDTVGRNIFNHIESNHASSLLKTYSDGIKRVKNNGGLAVIGEHYFLSYIADNHNQIQDNCNNQLIVLPDSTKCLYKREYGIALPKGSPYMQLFNEAIRQFKNDGTIDRLQQIYWNNNNNNNNKQSKKINTC